MAITMVVCAQRRREAEAGAALRAKGMSVSDAVRMIWCALRQRKPFLFAGVPSPVTRKAMRELDRGKGKRYKEHQTCSLWPQPAKKKRPPESGALVRFLEASCLRWWLRLWPGRECPARRPGS